MFRVCVAVLWAVTASAAEPQAQEQARALVRQAKSAFDAGQFEQAAELLEQATALTPTPATLYNLARAREKAEQLERAVEAYRAYLQAAPDTKDRGAVEATIDELTRRIEEKKKLAALENQPARVVEVQVPVEAPARTVRVADVAPWLVAALGAAGIAAGAVLGVMAQGSYSTAMTDLGVDAKLAFAEQQRAFGQAAGANGAYVVGGFALAAGILWWLIAHVGAR
jgi:tetratricopeptide (TPR) repeat protein